MVSATAIACFTNCIGLHGAGLVVCGCFRHKTKFNSANEKEELLILERNYQRLKVQILNMKDFHLRGTGLEDHSLLNEDQVAVKKFKQYPGSAGLYSRRFRVTSCWCWALVAFLCTLWLTFLGLWLYYNYFRPQSDKAVVVGFNREADLIVLPGKLADASGAYCLDGSPPSYYFRNASSAENEDSWIIHLHGSSWCYNNGACAHRRQTQLGSSRMLRRQRPFFGILSADVTVNPEFYDWNAVVVNYCDGASFSGNRKKPIMYNNTKVYYRGARVLDAVVDYLLQTGGLADAKRVIFGGDSAGALGVFVHADRIRRKMPAGVSFKAMTDGGFFIDEKSPINGVESWQTLMKRVFRMQQVQGSLDEDCLLAKSRKTKWECFIPEFAYPYVNTPLFLINSAYDSAQWRVFSGCHPDQCKDGLAVLGKHKDDFLKRIDQVNRYDKDGMFISSCYVHRQATLDHPWTTYKVAGKTTRKSFGDWFFERNTPEESKCVDCSAGRDCNPTCRETWCSERNNTQGLDDYFT